MIIKEEWKGRMRGKRKEENKDRQHSGIERKREMITTTNNKHKNKS